MSLSSCKFVPELTNCTWHWFVFYSIFNLAFGYPQLFKYNFTSFPNTKMKPITQSAHNFETIWASSPSVTYDWGTYGAKTLKKFLLEHLLVHESDLSENLSCVYTCWRKVSFMRWVEQVGLIECGCFYGGGWWKELINCDGLVGWWWFLWFLIGFYATRLNSRLSWSGMSLATNSTKIRQQIPSLSHPTYQQLHYSLLNQN